MFKTRKTLEIEYDPTSQELEHLEDAVELVKNLAEILEKEEEKVVYFDEIEYSVEEIKSAYCLLNNMLRQRYGSNILEP